jgi:L-ascorbate 6-phosphate lactonase
MKSSLYYTFLGQVGVLISYGGINLIIDPYLSDYVKDLYGERFVRNYPFDFKAVDLSNIDYCLITHAHEDHCDPNSINLLLKQNNDLKVICDFKSREILKDKVEVETKVFVPKVGEEIIMTEEIKVKTIPSAHTKISIKNGFSEFNGYIIHVGKYTLYHPGDTIPNREIEEYLPNKIDLAFMPINERNFFRDEIGIIGNMTIREAQQWSRELGIKKVIATHWDLFELNSTSQQELVLANQLDKNVQLVLPIHYKKETLNEE